MNYVQLLKEQFNGRVSVRERRPEVFQLIVPLYHEDGDMVDIFLQTVNGDTRRIRISDLGMTLMRLSYTFDIDTPNKEAILQKILAENGATEDNGEIYLETTPESLYPAVLQFAQVASKISNMELLKREVIKSLFYEMLEDFVTTSLVEYGPRQKVYPIPDRDELEVDYEFNSRPRPIYLFGVKDTAKARIVTISCLEFQKAELPFRSCVVHEDFGSLGRKDQNRITSAADKQFVTLDDFKDNAVKFFEREGA